MSSFAETPRVFVPIASPGKTRIYLVTHESNLVRLPELSQVATVTGPPELGQRLIAALNTAAWSGRMDDLEQIAPEVPDAVMQGCRAAVAQCPSPASLALGLEDAPMAVLRESWFRFGSDDLATMARAAMEVGLQFIFENELDEDGSVEIHARLLSDERETRSEDADRWWPAPQALHVADRVHPAPDGLADVLKDVRWRTRQARGYWLWIEDDAEPDSYTARWVIEFFDAELEPDRN